MANPNGRPKGPVKKRVLITLLEDAHKWASTEAEARGLEGPAAFIARDIEQRAGLHRKNRGVLDRTKVTPNFKAKKS